MVSWMDPYDDNWRREKAKYWAIEINDPDYDPNQVARFRDWDNFHFWFRAVEKFAPWVHKFYLVTWDTIPKWLNTEHPKVEVIHDRDIIPNGFAPAFGPNPMETNLHRIPGISEHFVFFNDDMFLLQPVEPNDFYVNGQPREMAVAYTLSNNLNNDPFVHMLLTMTGVINGFFSKREVQKKNLRKWLNPIYGKQLINTISTLYNQSFSGIMVPHLPSSMRKSTYEEVWNAIPDKLMTTASHRFRNPTDITQYIFRYWAIAKGEFEPTNVFRYGREFFMNDASLGELCEVIERQQCKLLCINDNKDIRNFDRCRDAVIQSFSKVFPEKSQFEL